VVDTLIPAALARAKAPGAVVALVENGRISLAKGYGLADTSGRQMTDSTPIGVASVSKPVFSWAVVRLAAEKRLPLDQPIGAIVKQWSPPASRFDPGAMTPRGLLSHTAGTGMLSVPCFRADSALPTIIEVLNGTAGDRGRVELIQAAGSAWRYSGGGYTLLQLAIEQATGQTLSRLMENQLFEPLGMARSDYRGPRPTDAAGFDEAGNRVHPVHCIGEAAAALVTTAGDMARLLVEYGRAHRGKSRVLPAGWIDTITTPIIKTSLEIDGKSLDMGDTQMGLGHFIHRSKDGRRMLFHSGGNPGVVAYLLIDLDRDGGLFVAVNSDRGRAVIEALIRSWANWHRTDPPTFF
jgi:CubicO group peptidase (beta-lactamase class C family)